MSARNPRDPGLFIKDGVPHSARFDDLYFSRDGGLAECEHVFLQGCHLPYTWARGRRTFTVAETGFGTGLNFLATWDLWRRNRPAETTLHYLAIEGFPVPRGSLAKVLAPFTPVRDLSQKLLAAYPAAEPGLHRIWFQDDGVCLTLAIGTVETVLPTLSARVDAWFLDGFAPAKNPDMWSLPVLTQVARLSVPGATLASFTSAGAVRRALGDVGFDVTKRPGFAGKRECIQGRYRVGIQEADTAPWFAAPEPISPTRVAVVGAGVAGAALVGSLARRGVETTWIDRRKRLAAEASGNPLALLMPRPSLGKGGGAQINPSAFRYAVEEANRLGVEIGGNGVVEMALDRAAEDRFATLAETEAFDGIATRFVGTSEASRVAGVTLDRPALWHARAGWIQPKDWVTALAGGARPVTETRVGELQQGAEAWRVLDAEGTVLAECDAVVIAAGADTAALLKDFSLPLEPVRGQLSRLPETPASRRLAACIAYGGYLSPAIAGHHVAGATYDRQGFDPDAWPMPVRAGDHKRTFDAMPEAIRRLFGSGTSTSAGRASLRAATPDRQPVSGPLALPGDLAATYAHLRTDAKRLDGDPPPYRSGIFVLGGLGSRGLVTAPLLAELLTAQIFGEPWPTTIDTAIAVHPNRFAIRALKRRQL